MSTLPFTRQSLLYMVSCRIPPPLTIQNVVINGNVIIPFDSNFDYRLSLLGTEPPYCCIFTVVSGSKSYYVVTTNLVIDQITDITPTRSQRQKKG
jgi:hypothetical protein